MAGTLYDHICLIDSSAAIALQDSSDQYHEQAIAFLRESRALKFAALNLTAHEVYTRCRYQLDCDAALTAFDYLRRDEVQVLEFLIEDELGARQRLLKFKDHKISFHDAICASAMLRRGIYKVFTFDRDFLILGFEVLPPLGS